jgi:acyl-CoA dehydrogenase
MPLDVVRALLAAAPATPVASCAALRVHPGTAFEDTVERAAVGGRAAASVGWAFACGYEAALARLDPAAVGRGSLAALCATEEGGGHPRAIRTSLVLRPDGGGTLTGQKSWVTLGSDAQTLLVVASTGQDEQGRNRLRVVRVPASRAGVRVEPGPPIPFASDIGHARAVFEGVAVEASEVLPGDGYDTVLKPFRTIEDIHVMAAILGWGIGVARSSGWEPAWTEHALAVLLSLRTLGAASPSDPATHVALAGGIAETKQLLESGAWERAAPAVKAGWERDRALLGVASTVRAARLKAAWLAFGAALLLLLSGCAKTGTGTPLLDAGGQVGDPCNASSDCTGGAELCGFPIDAGCAAQGVCVPEDLSCTDDGPVVCGCNGDPVGLACIWGAGYAPLPVVSTTPGCAYDPDAGSGTD